MSTRRGEGPLSDEQIAAAFQVVIGVPPRAADLAALRFAHDEVTLDDLAQYLWDHWLGEPEDLTPEDVAAQCIPVLS